MANLIQRHTSRFSSSPMTNPRPKSNEQHEFPYSRGLISKPPPPPVYHQYHVASTLRFQHVRVLSSPSRQRRRPITLLLHSLPHSLSLSAPHLLCIAHHSFISWWPSKKKKPNKNSFSARGACLLLIAGVRMPRCRGQFLRTNQSFTSSTRRTVFISFIRLILSIFYVIFSFVIFSEGEMKR